MCYRFENVMRNSTHANRHRMYNFLRVTQGFHTTWFATSAEVMILLHSLSVFCLLFRLGPLRSFLFLIILQPLRSISLDYFFSFFVFVSHIVLSILSSFILTKFISHFLTLCCLVTHTFFRRIFILRPLFFVLICCLESIRFASAYLYLM